MKKVIREAMVTVDGKSVPQAGWKNKPKTGELECYTCGTWISHWESCTGKDRPSKCSVAGCNKDVTDGAHVFNTDLLGTWIAPTCHECNVSIKNTFSLKKDTILVNPHTHKYGGTIEPPKSNLI